MKNKKWGVVNSEDPIYVVLFVSRTKDNKHLSDFTERRKSFITQKSVEELDKDFDAFVRAGRPDEFCRFYYSVNARDAGTIRKKLLHFLIDEDDFNLCALPSKIAGLAAQKDAALEKKWMIDFDAPDVDKVVEFIDYVHNKDATITSTFRCTPNGYAIILSHGFDVRDFDEKWGDIATVKKDDLLCVDWRETE